MIWSLWGNNQQNEIRAIWRPPYCSARRETPRVWHLTFSIHSSASRYSDSSTYPILSLPIHFGTFKVLADMSHVASILDQFSADTYLEQTLCDASTTSSMRNKPDDVYDSCHRIDSRTCQILHIVIRSYQVYFLIFDEVTVLLLTFILIRPSVPRPFKL